MHQQYVSAVVAHVPGAMGARLGGRRGFYYVVYTTADGRRVVGRTYARRRNAERDAARVAV